VAMEIRTDTAFQSELTDLARQLERELSSLSRELEGVRKDAERWRQVRECTYRNDHEGRRPPSWTVDPGNPHQGEAVKEAFERAIDSALRE
jgi:hypothetical protein